MASNTYMVRRRNDTEVLGHKKTLVYSSPTTNSLDSYTLDFTEAVIRHWCSLVCSPRKKHIRRTRMLRTACVLSTWDRLQTSCHPPVRAGYTRYLLTDSKVPIRAHTSNHETMNVRMDEKIRPYGTSCAQQHGLPRQGAREGRKTLHARPDTHFTDIAGE